MYLVLANLVKDLIYDDWLATEQRYDSRQAKQVYYFSIEFLLGRLAACFIDSMAALQLPGHGCSIRYQYGLFEQHIVDGQQVELPDTWLQDGFPWETKRSDKAVHVRFGGNCYMRPDGKGGAGMRP